MSIVTVVQALTEFAEEMESDYEHSSAADHGAEPLAILLAAIRDCRAGLAEFASRVEKDLLSEMGGKTLTVMGLGVVEAKKSKKYTKWDNDSLWQLLTAYAQDERRLDETTGEYEPIAQAVARVLGECARPSWRLTPLRARGIDVSEYCEVEDDGWRVQLPSREI